MKDISIDEKTGGSPPFKERVARFQRKARNRPPISFYPHTGEETQINPFLPLHGEEKWETVEKNKKNK